MRVARLATMSSRNYVYDLMARVAISRYISDLAPVTSSEMIDQQL
jgi:hypothetical protein